MCLGRECSVLAPPEHGSVSGNGRTVGDEVTYSCDDGYIIQEDSYSVCLPHGGWSADTPICKGKS